MKYKILGLILLVLIAAGVLSWQGYRVRQSVKPENSATAYTNNQYGFSIPLSDSWKGYQAIAVLWQGRDVGSGNVKETGPVIILRHPLWTQNNPREDMPIMVFTKAQWDLVMKEQIAVSAAPISPSVLGQNSKYILALPARYNYDYKSGWEEVDQLVHGLRAFEPK